MNRKSVMLCLKEFKEGGIENALFDAPGCCRNAEITDEEKTWIINTTYRRPVDFGYAAKTWTYTKLISHIHKTAEAAGYTIQDFQPFIKVHLILFLMRLR